MNDVSTNDNNAMIPRQWKSPGLSIAAMMAAWVPVGISIGMHDIRWLLYVAMPVWLMAWAFFAFRFWNREVSGNARKLVLGVYTVFALFLASSTFLLSDDIYRYVWEGSVVATGGNPYAHAPSSEVWTELRSEMPETAAGVNNPDLSAIYPPLPQYVLGFLMIFWRSDVFIRILWVALLFFAIYPAATRWLEAEGLPKSRALILITHPLVPLEVFLSGHLDVLMMLGAVMLFLGVSANRMKLGVVGFTATVLTKLAPLILLPQVLQRIGNGERRDAWRRRGVFVFAAVGLCIVSYLPFISAGWGLFGSLGVYNRLWESNGFLYPMASGFWNWIDPEGTVVGGGLTLLGMTSLLEAEGFAPLHPNLLGARGLCGLAFLIVYTITLFRRDPIDRVWLAVVGAGLLCSPVVHPWYLLALLPACMRGGPMAWAGLWWASTIPFTYAVLPGWWERGEWNEPQWAWWLEYGGMIVALVVARFYKR